eukprot:scaffold284983_cov34-Tisochrysis_lutea.AAC.2
MAHASQGSRPLHSDCAANSTQDSVLVLCCGKRRASLGVRSLVLRKEGGHSISKRMLLAPD